MNKIFPVVLLSWILFSADAQSPNDFSIQKKYTPSVTSVHLLGVTPPLRSFIPDTRINFVQEQKEAEDEDYYPTNPSINADALPQGMDQLLSSSRNINTTNDIDTVFTMEGLHLYLHSNPNNSIPDPNGDIGLNEYVQMTNSDSGAALQVFDKLTGQSLFGPVLLNAFLSVLGANGHGDPVVMYDQEAQRWLLSQMGPTAESIAISQTSDPLGSYYVYSVPVAGMDYPKYFIWPDAYYFTGTTGATGANSPIYALNRADLLAGVPITTVLSWSVPGFSPLAFQVATGADWDGSLAPPAGSPAYVFRIYDDSWAGGNDHLEVWDVHTDWITPSNSSITGPANIPVTPFMSQLTCAGFGCINQLNGSPIYTMQQILMHRVQYRNFGSYESIVCNHIVNTGTGISGIRWYELRKAGVGAWSLFQEGTHSPDNDSRFMPAIAQDGFGNIALGYTVTGSIYPSLRIVAHHYYDPPGQMSSQEIEIATGLTASTTRWGDYAGMNVDPTDDRYFWFTGEYRGQPYMHTKIVKFRLQKDSDDVAPVQLLQPVTSGNLSATETISVSIYNDGLNPESNFPVSYSINGAPAITEINLQNIPPDSTINFTFATTADLSLVNTSYDIKIYTGLTTDDNHFNDTLNILVRHLSQLDAEPELSGTLDSGCGSIREVGFIIKNAGAALLTTANLNYSLNGGPIITIPWSGNLAYNDVDTVIVSLSNLINGTNTLTYFTSSPNGNPDQFPSNDTVYALINEIVPGTGFTVEVETDGFPNETTWELLDGNNNLIYQAGPYSLPHHIYQNYFCLPGNCYKFTIYDQGGDGISAPGYLKITRDDGQILATLTQNNFGSSEFHSVCLLMVNIAAGSSESIHVALQPNPVHDRLLVSAKIIPGREVLSYTIFDISGRDIMNGNLILHPDKNSGFIEMKDILPGIYFLRIQDGNYFATARFVRF